MFQLQTSQRFIKSSLFIDNLIKKADINNNSFVLEIGCGTGIITERLVKKAGYIISIENDKRLYEKSFQRLCRYKNLELINADFFKIKLPKRNYICFSNIPFHRTRDIVQKLLLEDNSCMEAYLFMQKEAAEKFLGDPYSNLVSLQLAPLYHSEILYKCKKSDFDPKPSVDIVFIAFRKRSPPDFSKEEYRRFITFIIWIFKNCKQNVKYPLLQKMSYKNLKQLEKKYHFKMTDGPSRLSYDQWKRMYIYVRRINSFCREPIV